MPSEINSKNKLKALLFGSLALFLISFAAMSSYFSYDEIGALAPRLKDERGFSSTDFLTLYTAYSISVILFVAIGGVLVDKLGVKKSAIIFASMFAAGTFLVTIPSFTVMFLGRLLFGIGCEAFYVVMQKIIAKWFKNKFLATAFAVNLVICRLGTLASFNLVPVIAEKTSTTSTLLIVTGITFIGLLSSIAYWFLDEFGERKRYVAIYEGSKTPEEDFKLRDIFKLPAAFWAISLLCVVYYSAIFPFTAFATDFFVEHYKITNEAAGKLTSVITFIAIATTWVFGLLIDKVGKRATIMIIGAATMIPCHISMGYTGINPVIPMAVLGLSFSLVPAALWPAVPLIVKERQLGTAYGVISMIQNIGLGLFPLLVGIIHDSTIIYKPALMFFPILALFRLPFSFAPATALTSTPLIMTGTLLPHLTQGIITTVQNVATGLFPLPLGLIPVNTGTYRPALLLFPILGILGVIFAIWLKILEKKGGGYLDKV